MNNYFLKLASAYIYKVAEEKKKRNYRNAKLLGDSALAVGLAGAGGALGDLVTENVLSHVRDKVVPRALSRIRRAQMRINDRSDRHMLNRLMGYEEYRAGDSPMARLTRAENRILKIKDKMYTGLDRFNSKTLPKLRNRGAAAGALLLAAPAFMMMNKHFKQKS